MKRKKKTVDWVPGIGESVYVVSQKKIATVKFILNENELRVEFPVKVGNKSRKATSWIHIKDIRPVPFRKRRKKQ